jgi:hypothetical protein
MDTFFRALTACFGANPAMFHTHFCMLLAFFRAGRTDVCAQLTKAVHIGAVHHHDLRGRAADGRAFQVKLYACFQLFDLLFFQTGGSALMTHAGAVDTGIDARLIFCVRHIDKF